MRCIDCFWFGYFRIEQVRGGGTTWFHPESLTIEVREALLQGNAAEFGSSLSNLLARDKRVACLREVTDSAGQCTAVEPAYDQLEAGRDFGIIRKTACRQRQCAGYGDFDPSLTLDTIKVYGVPSPKDHSARGGAYAEI
jgi:hypothetical protein